MVGRGLPSTGTAVPVTSSGAFNRSSQPARPVGPLSSPASAPTRRRNDRLELDLKLGLRASLPHTSRRSLARKCAIWSSRSATAQPWARMKSRRCSSWARRVCRAARSRAASWAWAAKGVTAKPSPSCGAVAAGSAGANRSSWRGRLTRRATRRAPRVIPAKSCHHRPTP